MAIAGVDVFYEIGAGKVLSGLVKRIAHNAQGFAIGTPQDVASTVYHHLGIDGRRESFVDNLARPIHVIEHGEPIRELRL